jgi:hypothetical protein
VSLQTDAANFERACLILAAYQKEVDSGVTITPEWQSLMLSLLSSLLRLHVGVSLAGDPAICMDCGDEWPCSTVRPIFNFLHLTPDNGQPYDV